MSGPCRRRTSRKHPATLSDHPTKRSRRMSDRSLAAYFRGRDKINLFLGEVWKQAAIRKEAST